MRACWILLIAGLLAGCHNPFKRQPPSSRRSAEREDPVPAEPRPASASNTKGFLAGRVLDSFDRPVPKAAVQVVELRENGPVGAPFETESDKDGYITIPGLDANSSYRLIA